MRYLFLCLAAMCSYVAVAQLSPEETRRQAEQARHTERVKAREARTADFVKHMDSVVLSHSFSFLPVSFQLQPAGMPRQIVNPNFRLSIYKDFVDVYLPYFKGVTPPYFITILNYTVPYIKGYLAVQTDQGWTISFSSNLYSVNTYNFVLDIYSTTGEAIMDISSDFYNTVTYSGSIIGHY